MTETAAPPTFPATGKGLRDIQIRFLTGTSPATEEDDHKYNWDSPPPSPADRNNNHFVRRRKCLTWLECVGAGQGYTRSHTAPLCLLLLCFHPSEQGQVLLDAIVISMVADKSRISDLLEINYAEMAGYANSEVHHAGKLQWSSIFRIRFHRQRRMLKSSGYWTIYQINLAMFVLYIYLKLR